MANVRSIQLVVGDSLTIGIAVLDEEGEPLDLTSAAARWWMARSRETPVVEVLLKKEISSGVTIVGSPNEGNVEIGIEPGDTENVAKGTYVQELEVVTADGKVYTADDLATITLKPGLIR